MLWPAIDRSDLAALIPTYQSGRFDGSASDDEETTATGEQLASARLDHVGRLLLRLAIGGGLDFSLSFSFSFSDNKCQLNAAGSSSISHTERERERETEIVRTLAQLQIAVHSTGANWSSESGKIARLVGRQSGGWRLAG